MALILTFLGKGGTGKTTIAIATAQKLASEGRRVLLAGQDPSPVLGILLETSVSFDPQPIAANLDAVQLQTPILLERSWEELKQLETQYLRTPVLKNVYGQELGVLPGMDSALALNAIRQYDASGKYDVIIYDGNSNLDTLRMMGMPEIFSWYIRRFRKVVEESDFWRAISPFIQPVTSVVLNVSWTGDNFGQQPTNDMNNILERGKAAIADPNRVAAYLVTNETATAIATAQYLWGSAQQVGLTVGGVLLNQAPVSEGLTAQFAPLPVTGIPAATEKDWATIGQSLPDFTQAAAAPHPIDIDVVNRQVKLFLPGFDKKQVKLSQSGPEVTIDAGSQRRNIFLPPALSGESVKGAKFQNSYLIISF
jgi:anion-transporting  ArsA/GET3 family ATPase